MPASKYFAGLWARLRSPLPRTNLNQARPTKLRAHFISRVVLRDSTGGHSAEAARTSRIWESKQHTHHRLREVSSVVHVFVDPARVASDLLRRHLQRRNGMRYVSCSTHDTTSNSGSAPRRERASRRGDRFLGDTVDAGRQQRRRGERLYRYVCRCAPQGIV